MPGKRYRQPIRQSKKALLLLLVSLPLLLCAVGAGLGSIGYRAQYTHDLALATLGSNQLRGAVTLLETLPQHPLDARLIARAGTEFHSAQGAFIQLEDALQSLPGISTQLPIYGARLTTARQLVSLASAVSAAGIAGCALLTTIEAHTSLGPQPRGLTPTDITAINHDFALIADALNGAFTTAKQVRPEDLQFDASLYTLFTTADKQLPTLSSWFGLLKQAFPALPTLLGIGQPAQYLLEILDSTELRPDGGFIGNYGILTLSGGVPVSSFIRDVTLLDRPYLYSGHSIPYPPAYAWFTHYLAPEGWSLRDSNLDADFPTAARYGEQNYEREGGNVPLQGVIAITPAFVQQLLMITGPISVPAYHETVTAQNLIERIHHYQLGGRAVNEGSGLIPSADGISSQRKHFTALLAEQMMTRMRQLPETALPQVERVFFNALHTKDLQLYFNTASAESLLLHLQLGAAIQPPNGDTLFIVNANVTSNKASNFISNTLDDQVTIDAAGNAVHHTTMRYAWTTPGDPYGSLIYRDYMRVYVPPNSVLQSQVGWRPDGTSSAFGYELWSGFFKLAYKQTHTISFVWTVSAAAHLAQTIWNYQDTLPRQPGINWTVNLSVVLPICANITGTTGALIALTRQSARFSGPLLEDLHTNVRYTCQTIPERTKLP